MILQKDRRGKELIDKHSIPDADGNFNEDPESLKEFYDYNLQDVRVQNFLAGATPPLTDSEHLDWVLNEKVNDAGLKIDRELAVAATKYYEAEIKEISEKLAKATDNKITGPRQTVRIKKYILPLIENDELAQKAMLNIKTNRRTGESKRLITVDRDARSKLLALETEHPGRLPKDVVTVIELLEEAGRSSVHKYRNMIERAGADDRVRGLYLFSGASQTGRHSSMYVQVHNLPRKTEKEPEVVRQNILQGKTLTGGVTDTLFRMVRYAIMAEKGHSFVGGDWSAIEARMLPFLSGDEDGYRVLEIIRRADENWKLPDIYKVAAGQLFKIAPEDVTGDQRQVGKVSTLAPGYGGGVRAFQTMARGYGVAISDDEAEEIVKAWRWHNPWAKRFWNSLETAARNAVRYPSELYEGGKIKYCRPSENTPLYCELPSGRILSYPDPKIETEEGPFGPESKLSAIKPQWKPKRGETAWGRLSLYGGLLAQNVTQAAAADILRHAMRLTDEDGWPLVGTTHDELLLEVRDDEIVDATGALEAIMLDKPAWAEGLPLACEIWNGKRYQK